MLLSKIKVIRQMTTYLHKLDNMSIYASNKILTYAHYHTNNMWTNTSTHLNKTLVNTWQNNDMPSDCLYTLRYTCTCLSQNMTHYTSLNTGQYNNIYLQHNLKSTISFKSSLLQYWWWEQICFWYKKNNKQENHVDVTSCFYMWD